MRRTTAIAILLVAMGIALDGVNEWQHGYLLTAFAEWMLACIPILFIALPKRPWS